MRCLLTCFITFIFLSSGIPFACQTPVAPSEEMSLRDSIDMVTKEAFYLLFDEQLDSALVLSEWALEESQRISYLFGQAESYSRLGGIYDEKEQYEEGLEFLKRSHALREELLSRKDSHLYEKRLVASHNDLALLYDDMGKFTQALAEVRQGLEFVAQKKEEWTDTLSIAYRRTLLHTKGTIFFDWGKLDSALVYYMKSLAEAEPVDLHPHYTEITEYDLVLLFSDLGIQDTLLDKLLRQKRESPTFLAYLLEAKAQRLIDQGKNREGRDSLYKSLDIRTKEKDTLSMGMNRYNLAISFSNEGNYEEASVQMDMAMALYESQQQETRFSEALTSLSILANAKNETEEALKYGKEAYVYAMEANDLDDAARAATQLVALYEKVGQYDSAFHYQIRYREHRDALNAHREAAIQIAEENRRKAEVQAVNLENFKKTQRLINIAVGVLITILLMLIFLIVRQAIQKRKLAEYKLQEKETAQKYLQYQRKGEYIERQRMAHDLHDGLCQILNSADTMLGIVGNEAESLREEVLIQFHKAEDWIKEANKNLRLITQNKSKEAYSGFGIGGWAHELKDRIESSSSMQVQVDLLDLNEPLKEDAELELILIMQELVNNAQKYSNGKFLTIQIIREGADLNMMIEDDGQGFDTQKALRKKSSGLGLESMKRRVENNLGGTIVFDSVIDQGTSVVIQIPHIFLLKNKNENHV